MTGDHECAAQQLLKIFQSLEIGTADGMVARLYVMQPVNLVPRPGPRVDGGFVVQKTIRTLCVEKEESSNGEKTEAAEQEQKG